MSGSWLIIRTEHSKEQYVERQIANMGYASWCPVEIVAYRTIARGRARLTKDRPVLPKRLFCCVPRDDHPRLLKIRYCVAIERNVVGDELRIPDRQLALFRAKIDSINKKTIERIQQGLSKKEKAVWKTLQEGLQEMIDQAKREEQEREEAA